MGAIGYLPICSGSSNNITYIIPGIGCNVGRIKGPHHHFEIGRATISKSWNVGEGAWPPPMRSLAIDAILRTLHVEFKYQKCQDWTLWYILFKLSLKERRHQHWLHGKKWNPNHKVLENLKSFYFQKSFFKYFFSLWSSFADLVTSQPSSYLIPSLQPCIVHSVLNFVIELAQQI